jgi:hypothetical protein
MCPRNWTVQDQTLERSVGSVSRQRPDIAARWRPSGSTENMTILRVRREQPPEGEVGGVHIERALEHALEDQSRGFVIEKLPNNPGPLSNPTSCAFQVSPIVTSLSPVSQIIATEAPPFLERG